MCCGCFDVLGVRFLEAGLPFRSTECRARELVEIMDGDLPLGDPPDTVTSREAVLVGRANKSGLGAVRQQPHAVHIAEPIRCIRPGELHHQIRGHVLRLRPGGPEHLVDRLVNAFVTGKIAKGWADFPHAVIPPDRQKALVVSLVETVAIIANQRLDLVSRFQPVQAGH
jgi:hypothetical protein